VLALVLGIGCSQPDTARDGVPGEPAPASPGPGQSARPAVTGDDPWAELDSINELPTDLEQQIAVEQLLVHAPGAYPPPPAICARLKREPARERCSTLAKRPHLIEKSESSLSGAPAPDPEAAALEFACFEAPCEDGQTPFECARELAEAASRHEGGDVVGICGCLDDLDLRRECQFFAAQEAVRSGGAAAMQRAFPLCDFGGQFQSDCVWHVLEPVLGDSGGRCPVMQEQWAELFEVGLGFGGGGREADPETVQARWSKAATSTFREVFCLPPAVASALPTEAMPHLRAVAAWYVIAGAAEGGDLDQLRRSAAAALAGESVLGPVQDREIVDFHTAPPQRKLPGDLPAGVVRRVHLVNGTRVTSPDPEVDLTICLLEAEARLRRDPGPLLSQVGPSDDPALGITVERLRQLARGAE